MSRWTMRPLLLLIVLGGLVVGPAQAQGPQPPVDQRPAVSVTSGRVGVIGPHGQPDSAFAQWRQALSGREPTDNCGPLSVEPTVELTAVRPGSIQRFSLTVTNGSSTAQDLSIESSQ